MNHKRMMDARLRRDLNERKSLLRNLNDREKLTLKEKEVPAVDTTGSSDYCVHYLVLCLWLSLLL